MCDTEHKIAFKYFDESYEYIWAAFGELDAISLMQARVNLKKGDVVYLTDGRSGVVIENMPESYELIVDFPIMVEDYYLGACQQPIPYTVVANDYAGDKIAYEDVVRKYGPAICRNCISTESWEEAARTLDEMRFLSMDISEFAGDLSTIYSNLRRSRGVA